jgi:hypothetical protein
MNGPHEDRNLWMWEDIEAVTVLLDAVRVRPATEPPDDDRWVLAKFEENLLRLDMDNTVTVARYYRDEGCNNSDGYEPATEGWETAEGNSFEWNAAISWRELPE